MKKSVKIISTLILAVMLVMSIASIAIAAPDTDKIIGDIENGGQGTDPSKITTIGGNIVNIIQVVGIVIAIIVLLVIGIKYIIGSAEEKADYKKSMIPYIVGAALIFAASAFAQVIYGFFNGWKIS